jgi:hypothetical protein
VTDAVPVEDHLAELAKASAEVDKWSRQLIVDELAELMPGLEAAEESAAARLRDALEALKAPGAAIADLDAAIGRAETELASWRDQLEGGDVAARVDARRWIAEWETERDTLTARRDYAAAEMLPLADVRNRARADLELAQGAKTGLAFSMCIPFESPVGQATRAYIGYRQPRLAYVLLKGDSADPEWECAVAELRELCISAMRGGYNVAPDLPDPAAVAAAGIAAPMADAMATPPDAVPSMTEVLALDKARMEDLALQQQPSRIDDYRAPAPPREVPDRPYMRVPRVKDMLG